MTFLISSDWVIGEAEDLGIHVPETAVKRQFDHLRANGFPKRGEFTRFLKESGESIGDLLFRVRLNMLSTKIQQRIASSPSPQQAIEHFIETFKSKWRSQTYCLPAYAVSDCGHQQSPL